MSVSFEVLSIILVQIPPYKCHTRSLHVVGARVRIVEGGVGDGSIVFSSAVVGTRVTISGEVGSAVKSSAVVGSPVTVLVGASVTNSGKVGSAVIISAEVGTAVVAFVGTNVITSGEVGSAVITSAKVGSVVVPLVGTSVITSGAVGAAVIISAEVGVAVVTFFVGDGVNSIDDGWGVSFEQTSLYSQSTPSPNMSVQHSVRLSKNVKSSTALAGISYPLVHWNVSWLIFAMYHLRPSQGVGEGLGANVSMVSRGMPVGMGVDSLSLVGLLVGEPLMQASSYGHLIFTPNDSLQHVCKFSNTTSSLS